MLYSGTDPESSISEYAFVYEECAHILAHPARLACNKLMKKRPSPLGPPQGIQRMQHDFPAPPL